MTITRIYTDISAGDDERFLLAMIRADGGRVEQRTENRGRITIAATFPNQSVPIEVPQPGAAAADWMAIARAELERGDLEVQGTGSNRRIEESHATTGDTAIDDVPWCSSFVNFCITRSGRQGTNSKLARSWTTWGVASPSLVPGCIVVLERGEPAKGHVGFFIGMDGSRIQLLGGNQGDAVSIASFDIGRVVARRLPA